MRFIHDVIIALMLLSRLPLPRRICDAASASGITTNRGLWAFPLVGAFIGGLAVLFAWLFSGSPAFLGAGLTLAFVAIITGAMHEDGLADSVDGLWGGWTKERRLEIMKDSHIGAYGTIALIFSIGLRWGALAYIFAAQGAIIGLIGVMAISRVSVVLMMGLLPQARTSGLSHYTGQPSPMQMVVATVLAFIIAACTLKFLALIFMAVSMIVTVLWTFVIRAKVGGQTGDLLGANLQINEIILLLTFASLVSGA